MVFHMVCICLISFLYCFLFGFVNMVFYIWFSKAWLSGSQKVHACSTSAHPPNAFFGRIPAKWSPLLPCRSMMYPPIQKCRGILASSTADTLAGVALCVDVASCHQFATSEKLGDCRAMNDLRHYDGAVLV